MQALIEQLKERFTSCLDEERNVTDMTGALDVIGRLENTVVTKEALEATRLGAFVNDIRKKYAQTQPELSKRCRNLIKEWQKLLTPTTSTGATLQASNSATSSPAGGGALTTPRGSAAKLVAAGLICSPSPSLMAKQLTPKTTTFVNGGIRANSNSPRFDSSKQHVHLHSNSYAPAAVATTSGVATKGPSPLAIYSSSANGGLTEKCTNSYSKTESPPSSSDVATTSSGQSTSTVAPPTLPKIRIKVGGGSESASIVKGSAETDVTTFDSNVGKKLPNGTNDNLDYHLEASTSACLSATIAPASMITSDILTSATLSSSYTKKVRQKRQHTDTDVADPLSLISKGRVKLKTTADLVAEMAGQYPEEMAKSWTKATLEVAESHHDIDEESLTVAVAIDQQQSIASSANKRSTKRTGGSLLTGGHDDYLDITKSEMVANYLKTSFVEDEEANDVDMSPSYSPPPYLSALASASELGQPRKRGRPRKYPDSHYHHRHTAVAARSIDILQIVNKSLEKADIEPSVLGVVKTPKKPINWYNILRPLDESDEPAQSSNPNVNTESACTSAVAVEKKLLDKYWPSGDSDEISLPTAVDHRVANAFDGSFPNLHSRILTSFGDSHRVLTMPYVDIGLPDFVEYRYPDSDRYIAHWSER